MDDIQTIIIDNGSGTMKFGLKGDDAPKSCFPTIIGRPKQPGQMVGMDQKDIYFGSEVSNKQSVLNISRPIIKGQIQNQEDIQKMYSYAFTTQLQLSPQDAHVLLTQSPTTPKKKKQSLMTMMFQKFGVAGYYCALGGVLSLYACGKTTGVAVDSGYALTSTIPVYQGFALSHATQHIDLGGLNLTQYLMDLMKQQGVSFSNIQETANSNARDTKQKICYVATDFQGSLKQFSQNPSKCITHKLPDGNQITLKSQAFKCPQALFQPSKIFNKQLMGIHQLTFQSILKCDSDIRKDLYANIVLAGGTSMLKSLAPSTMKISVFDPPQRKFSAWMGGSILASLTSFTPMFITKAQYQQGGASYVHRKCF